VAGPVVVVGDALLDADLTGRAGRLAPDAPVPVLDDLQEVRRPGGAALAAALAAGSGHEVVLVTALADDEDGARLAALVREAGVRLVALPHDGSTPVKRRVRAGGQSLLRSCSSPTTVAGSPRSPGCARRSPNTHGGHRWCGTPTPAARPPCPAYGW
jgi:bifunctional ADP-heptose synthase (sugar kinase/adenylyltransferase)